MPLDGLTLGFIARELQQTLGGARVERVTQPEKDMLVLLIRAQGKNHRLLLSAALLSLYGVSPRAEEAECAQLLASRLTKAELLGTIDLLQAYRQHCTYNVGVGPTLGGFAVELEEIL